MSTDLLPVYSYLTAGGITSGLSDAQPYFTLNEKKISIYSGAMHYFRVHPDYWRRGLKQMRAAGLNTVETYVPWNVHEAQQGDFRFDEPNLDLVKFLKTAQEEDLLAIVRPGPYICAEWDFGGLPSWLLPHEVKVRTSDEKFMKYVSRFFSVLLPILAALQFTKGGPIIAFQVENEYGSTEQAHQKPDSKYMQELYDLYKENDIVELLFTSDAPSLHGDVGSVPGGQVLQTANFDHNPEVEFEALKRLQPGKPLMVMEYWSGWFDHWGERHQKRSRVQFRDTLERILHYNASVNFYMFHGGTNWGFYNGANIPLGKTQANFQPDTTSYDYDAPITEYGAFTDKYNIVRHFLNYFNKIHNPILSTPKDVAPAPEPIRYSNIHVRRFIPYDQILSQIKRHYESYEIKPMEYFNQSYGYILYRNHVNLRFGAELHIKGHIYDSLTLLVDHELISEVPESHRDFSRFGFWKQKDQSLKLKPVASDNSTLDLLVENMGRVNFGFLDVFDQFKGLRDSVLLNDTILNNWQVYSMDFTEYFRNWSDFDAPFTRVGPALYKAILDLKDGPKPQDTFIDMSNWRRGFVKVNDFNIGRYMNIGPQQSLYIPGPLLKAGRNEIDIFEHFYSPGYIQFSEKPVYQLN